MFSGTDADAAEAVRLPAPGAFHRPPLLPNPFVILPHSDHKSQIFNLAFLLLAADQRVDPRGIDARMSQ